MISTTTFRPTVLSSASTGEIIPLSNQIFSTDRGYYRSKIFNTLIGINPLIAAASPIFSIAPILAENKSPIETYTLYQDLQHEIKAFENSAKIQHYRSDI